MFATGLVCRHLLSSASPSKATRVNSPQLRKSSIDFQHATNRCLDQRVDEYRSHLVTDRKPVSLFQRVPDLCQLLQSKSAYTHAQILIGVLERAFQGSTSVDRVVMK